MDPQNNHPHSDEESGQKRIRVWPGVLIVLLLLLIRYGVLLIFPEAVAFGVLGGLAGGLAVILWWVFFSKAKKTDRWGALLLMVVSLFVTSLFIDKSIATGGQGMMFIMYALPFLSVVFVIWAFVTRRFNEKTRRISMVITIVLASGIWVLFRIDGITGDFDLDLAWRWAKTSEEKFLLANEQQGLKTNRIAVLDSVAEWPGFRGPERNGIVMGVEIESDWSAFPPKELWRRPVGPGCSSFAVSGDYFFTQEQLGDDEMVTCYEITTGEPVWSYLYKARFWDSHAGAGPRSTPTLSNGRVYTMGATGILNVLHAEDGAVVWSRNAVEDTDLEHSGWGYASSPLVVDDVVIVAVVGKLMAYDIGNGDLVWSGPDGGDGYSSPHLMTIDGITQVILLSGDGVTSIAPSDGILLWQYSYESGSRIVQPAITSGGDLLISKGDASGISRIAVTNQTGEWKVTERWTSSQLKPNFNDLVVHKGFVYGYTGLSLTCIDAASGERMWRGSRYGGQLILLADQDLLLVLTEKGELVEVEATPEKFSELARIPAVSGKTWNHPVMVDDVLLIRNTEEMVAYRLPARG